MDPQLNVPQKVEDHYTLNCPVQKVKLTNERGGSQYLYVIDGLNSQFHIASYSVLTSEYRKRKDINNREKKKKKKIKVGNKSKSIVIQSLSTSAAKHVRSVATMAGRTARPSSTMAPSDGFRNDECIIELDGLSSTKKKKD
eukprot:Awhi_evm1s7048